MQQASWSPDLSSFIQVLVKGLLLGRKGDGFGLRQVALHCSFLHSLQVAVQLAHCLHTHRQLFLGEDVSCLIFILCTYIWQLALGLHMQLNASW